VAIAAGNTLEAIAGCWLVKRFAAGTQAFDSGRNVFLFVFLAALLSTLLSATIGVTSLVLGGRAQLSDVGPIWLTWWLGDASGDLIFAPLAILWSRASTAEAKRYNLYELILMFMSLAAVGLLVFNGPILPKYPLGVACLPILIWAGFRFGSRQAATATFLLCIVATIGTWRGYGPFIRGSPNASLLLLQGFMGVSALTSLVVAAVVSEKERAYRDAAAANAAKDEFLATLGHELRNPLAAIMNALSSARRDPSARERALEIASRQGPDARSSGRRLA
jgi:integral membrane sensor domain MASE1